MSVPDEALEEMAIACFGAAAYSLPSQPARERMREKMNRALQVLAAQGWAVVPVKLPPEIRASVQAGSQMPGMAMIVEGIWNGCIERIAAAQTETDDA